MYYVYLLRSDQERRYYIGYTSNLRRRLAEHQYKKNVSTAHREGLRLIYYEAYLNKFDALGREKFLKSGSGHRFLKKQLRHFLASRGA
jgi:putative endonuclease